MSKNKRKKVRRFDVRLKGLELQAARFTFALRDARQEFKEDLVPEMDDEPIRLNDDGGSPRNKADLDKGAELVLIEKVPGIGYEVHFDQDVVTLEIGGEKLVNLLVVLCGPGNGDGRAIDDHIVGMKSIDDLIEALFARTGERTTERAVRANVCRLRRSFLMCDHDPNFIETGSWAYRARLRRGGRVEFRDLARRLPSVA